MGSMSRGQKMAALVIFEVLAVGCLSAALTIVGVTEDHLWATALCWLAIDAVWVAQIASVAASNGERLIVMAAYLVRIVLSLQETLRIKSLSDPQITTSDGGAFWRVATYYYTTGAFDKRQTNFPYVLNALFHVFGKNYLCCLAFNSLIIAFAVALVGAGLWECRIGKRERMFAMTIVAFLPYIILASVDILREPIYIFLFAASFYAYLRFIRTKKYTHCIQAVIFVILCTWLHGGFFPVGIAYLLLGMSISETRKRGDVLQPAISLFTVIAMMAMISIFDTKGVVSSLGNPEELLSKISGENVSQRTLNAGSAYLLSLKANTWTKAILYAPIRLFYYIASPLPMNWRGTNDILAFLLDSTFHLGFLYVVADVYLGLRRQRAAKGDSSYNEWWYAIMKAALCCFLSCSIIFSFGTSNAGTAIRHRDSLIPIEAMGFAAALSLRSSLKVGSSGKRARSHGASGAK